MTQQDLNNVIQALQTWYPAKKIVSITGVVFDIGILEPQSENRQYFGTLVARIPGDSLTTFDIHTHTTAPRLLAASATPVTCVFDKILFDWIYNTASQYYFIGVKITLA